MNCKKGDLAVIVRCTPTTTHALGLVVTVVEALPPRQYLTAFGVDEPAPTWRCAFQRPTRNYRGTVYQTMCVPDLALRPIRDQPGTDEVIERIGKPEPVAA